MTRSQNNQSRDAVPLWPRPAVSAAVFRDGLVLLAQRGKPPLQGVWSLPGGRVEPGETARDAARRELAEETGITADLMGVADVVDVIVRDDDGSLRAHYVITAFFGVWTGGEATPGSDCQAVEWVALGDLAGRPMTEGTAAVIARAAGLLTADQD